MSRSVRLPGAIASLILLLDLHHISQLQTSPKFITPFAYGESRGLFDRGFSLFRRFSLRSNSCTSSSSGELGTCVFNYECIRKRGRIIGTCIDGFLFGACCHFPPAPTSPKPTSSENLPPALSYKVAIDQVTSFETLSSSASPLPSPSTVSPLPSSTFPTTTTPPSPTSVTTSASKPPPTTATTFGDMLDVYFSTRPSESSKPVVISLFATVPGDSSLVPSSTPPLPVEDEDDINAIHSPKPSEDEEDSNEVLTLNLDSLPTNPTPSVWTTRAPPYQTTSSVPTTVKRIPPKQSSAILITKDNFLPPKLPEVENTVVVSTSLSMGHGAVVPVSKEELITKPDSINYRTGETSSAGSYPSKTSLDPHGSKTSEAPSDYKTTKAPSDYKTTKAPSDYATAGAPHDYKTTGAPSDYKTTKGPYGSVTSTPKPSSTTPMTTYWSGSASPTTISFQTWSAIDDNNEVESVTQGEGLVTWSYVSSPSENEVLPSPRPTVVPHGSKVPVSPYDESLASDLIALPSLNFVNSSDDQLSHKKKKTTPSPSATYAFLRYTPTPIITADTATPAPEIHWNLLEEDDSGVGVAIPLTEDQPELATLLPEFEASLSSVLQLHGQSSPVKYQQSQKLHSTSYFSSPAETPPKHPAVLHLFHTASDHPPLVPGGSSNPSPFEYQPQQQPSEPSNEDQFILANLIARPSTEDPPELQEPFHKYPYSSDILTSSRPHYPKTTSSSTTTSTTTASTSSTTTHPPTTTSAPTPFTSKQQWDYRFHCGVRPIPRQGRIVGGKRTKFGDWPWQVLVRESTWLGLFTKNKCGGVLVNDRYVITAAHCQPGFLASLTVVLGEHDLSGNYEPMRTVERAVKRVVVHRDYNAKTFENDISILELETPVEFLPHIVPICMPKEGEDFVGKKGYVSGWGRLKYGGSVPNILMNVEVPVMPNSKCQQMFYEAGHPKAIRESFMCAGYPEGQRDSCEGDSGGPLMIPREDGRWVLAGTVSHGIKCAWPNLPGIYMRMTYYKPWMEKVMGMELKSE
ncbi:unnamed protein product [Cyprideis torosa]|uniref:Uncharacterized protein n=1 Tax=Cyprideis torosa TaxID=163714 RepID=A0A7R8WBN5_9CRUS|nr:unnamed protein product [Cyprideis torosa]CAG0887163.1 unnamed protein product [Cyprideis torosa]